MKKLKLINQFRDSILSPPDLVNDIIPIEGKLNFISPSTKNYNNGKKYNMTIEIKNFNIKFDCDCQNKLSINGACKHMRAMMLKMVIDLTNDHNFTLDMNDISKELERLHISDSNINTYINTYINMNINMNQEEQDIN